MEEIKRIKATNEEIELIVRTIENNKIYMKDFDKFLKYLEEREEKQDTNTQ